MEATLSAETTLNVSRYNLFLFIFNTLIPKIQIKQQHKETKDFQHSCSRLHCEIKKKMARPRQTSRH